MRALKIALAAGLLGFDLYALRLGLEPHVDAAWRAYYIAHSIDVYGFAAAERRLHPEQDQPSGLPPIHTDRHRFRAR